MSPVMLDPNTIPAHLRAQASDPLNAAAIAGVVGTMAPARISYRGSKFRLVDKDGVESDPVVVNDSGMAELENNGVAMDIVVVGANPFISKIYYDAPYDPNVDTAPACFSDNGVAPSERSGKPQSITCATCPHNVWGSAVNPSTGKARQACNNVKKLAVVRYKDEGNVIYSLGLPGASLKPYEAAMKAVTSHGYRIGGIIWRISFDREVAFPKLDFKAVGFLDEESMAEFEDLQKNDEVRLATGSEDVPMAAAAIEARRGMATLPPPRTDTPPRPLPQVYAGQVPHQRSEVERLEKTQVISGPPNYPQAATPATDQRRPTVVPPGMPQHTLASVAASQPPAPSPSEKRSRGRPRKYPQDDAQPAQPQVTPPPPPSPELPAVEPAKAGEMPPLPAFLDKRNKGPAELPAASSEMDDALSRAMGLRV